MAALKKMTGWLAPPKKKQQQRNRLTERDLIRMESNIGRQLFGPVPRGHRREFFCLDERTWVWYEEWREGTQIKSLTTRYEIRDNGVIKAQDGRAYQFVSDDEMRNLAQATKAYYELAARQIYGCEPVQI